MLTIIQGGDKGPDDDVCPSDSGDMPDSEPETESEDMTMTRREAGTAYLAVMEKLAILHRAADHIVDKDVGTKDFEDARKQLNEYYEFCSGAEIMLREAVATLKAIEEAPS